MIALENVTVQAGAFILRNVSFQVPTGGYAALMGRTGTGKTTLLEAICGLRPITEGRILLLGRDVTPLKPGERGLGYVPQDRALFQTMTVWEHLAFAMVVRKVDQTLVRARVEELADLLGLTPLLRRKPRGLSGGEAQRLALGRALSAQPRLLLLDEPLIALDEETRIEMYALLKRVRARTAVTILHVTHDSDEARHLADQLLLLKDGTVTEGAFPALPDGIPASAFRAPQDQIRFRPPDALK
jgi:molybdate/tungstate transport system ATP-binding protein